MNGRNYANRTWGLSAASTAAVGGGGASAAPLDFAHLRRYTLGDRTLEREVLELFLAQLPVTIAALRSAESDRDWKMAAHSLKGSGRAVGAWSLASCAERAENLQGGAAGVFGREQVALIEQEAAVVRQFITAAYQQP